VLTDPSVSRRHASFTRSSGRIRVRDRGSRNGIYCGGTKVIEADVQLGAVLRLGNTALALQPRWYVREVPPSQQTRFGELIGGSLAMRQVFAILERVAPTEVTVLVQGETGTGKELVARSIHRASPRAERPYVVFDCGTIPRELVESELFGHRRGAFSGAIDDRSGAFGCADGGTIVLDEIGELPLELQPKLLRVLETSEVRRVGDDAPRRVEVRVIAATNRNLQGELRRGRFRADLLYRLEVVKVELPPLRYRLEDVPLLTAHLLRDKLPAEDRIDGPGIELLTSYNWPGNVRELRNVLTRAMAVASRPGQPTRFGDLVFNLGPLESEPLTLGLTYPGVASSLPYKEAKARLLAEFERAYVETLLDRHHHRITAAAQAAGLSRKHLYELMRRASGEEPECGLVSG
jgi:transcriptional regulator with GAF, ATPase, and Fis domain